MSRFDDHQKVCHQCRVTPGNLCGEGKLLVLAEIENIPKSVQMDADGDALAGKALALKMMDAMDPEVEPSIIAHAIAFIFAALLSASDGVPSLSEIMGSEPIGDKEKIALLGLEIEGLVQQFRDDKLKRMSDG